MKLHILKVLAVTGLVMQLNATEVYTVDELILKSLKHSPNLHISKSNYEASQSRYDSAFSGYLPNVDFYGAVGEAGRTNSLSQNENMINDSIILGRLSARQIIYDFGKTGGNVDSSEFDSQAYRMQNIQDISDKKRDVKEAYYNVLKALALIEVQKENVKLNEAQLYRSQKYFEAGIRTKIDISDAKVTLIQSKLDLKRSEYDLELAYASLDAVVGFQELEREYRVYSEELNLNNLYASLPSYKLDLKESIVYSFEHRANIKKKESEIQASSAKIDEVSSAYYPSLYLSADYTKQQVDKFKQFVPKEQWQATLNLEWNLYEGGATSAKKQERVINVNIANATLSDTKLKIKKETTRAYVNLYKSKDSVALSESLVQVSSEKFDQASKRYEHGLSDYIELQQARQGYIDSKAALVVDYYNYYIAVAYLDNAIGK